MPFFCCTISPCCFSLGLMIRLKVPLLQVKNGGSVFQSFYSKNLSFYHEPLNYHHLHFFSSSVIYRRVLLFQKEKKEALEYITKRVVINTHLFFSLLIGLKTPIRK